MEPLKVLALYLQKATKLAMNLYTRFSMLHLLAPDVLLRKVM